MLSLRADFSFLTVMSCCVLLLVTCSLSDVTGIKLKVSLGNLVVFVCCCFVVVLCLYGSDALVDCCMGYGESMVRGVLWCD